MERMERVSVKEILTLFNLLVNVYEPEGLAVKCDFQLENIREVIMKLRSVWADNDLNLQIAMDTIHILTVIKCMMSKYMMDGGQTTDDNVFCQSVWVEPDRVCQPPPLTIPESLTSKLKACLNFKADLYRLTLKEVIGARKELKVMADLSETNPSLAQVAFRFNAAKVLLDDAELGLKALLLDDKVECGDVDTNH